MSGALTFESEMHTVVMRRDIYEKNRWMATALYKAFVEAQKITYQSLGQTAVLAAMLPWAGAEFERTLKLMGNDYWPYGYAANEHVLETFTRYSYESGLSKQKLDPQTLFAPETLEAFKVQKVFQTRLGASAFRRRQRKTTDNVSGWKASVEQTVFDENIDHRLQVP